jgi:hypothetical protein
MVEGENPASTVGAIPIMNMAPTRYHAICLKKGTLILRSPPLFPEFTTGSIISENSLDLQPEKFGAIRLRAINAGRGDANAVGCK